MRSLAVVASPVVHLLSGYHRPQPGLLGSSPSTEPPVTEDEIRVLLEQAPRPASF
jgi:putative hemolysin